MKVVVKRIDVLEAAEKLRAHPQHTHYVFDGDEVPEIPFTPPKRKVIQIVATSTQVGAVAFSTLVVLCDDGALLQYSPRQSPPWTIFPEVPGPEAELMEVSPDGNKEES